jgi:two-component system, chemotaxis family, chemotaxis protein CheY
MKYLIVDDSKMARKMIIKNLQSIIHETNEIIEASNGDEAVQLYKKYHPDICFMDLTMPVKDGFAAILEICSYDKDAKIIVISADIQELSMKKAKENGALGFIKKPVSEESLKSMLTTLGFI